MRVLLAIIVELTYASSGHFGLQPTAGGVGTGSIRFNQATQKEVHDFLSLYSKSVSGQFGMDFLNKPDMSVGNTEKFDFKCLIHFNSDAQYLLKLNSDHPIYFAHSTGVFEILNVPGKVIKYYAYCYASITDEFDATVVEAYFMKRIESLNPSISLRVYFYSGYVSEKGPLSFQDRKVPEADCGPRIRPQIRYMIMDKVGLSLKAYMLANGQIEFKDAFHFGIQMITLLKQLHDLDIVHGDAHMANFAFRTDDTSSGLILIDFGRSDYVDKITALSEPVLPNCKMIHPNAALWEMNGCKVSFRDDVYRAVQMTAMLLYGERHFEYLDSLITKHGDVREPKLKPPRNLDKYMMIKRGAKFWELGEYLTLDLILPQVTHEVRQQIRRHMETVSQILIGCQGFYTKPNYDYIIAEFRLIIDAIRY